MTPEKQYEKFAEWFERAALVFLASLVVQQIVSGVSPWSRSVLLGMIAAGALYAAAYGLVRKSMVR
ncbi:MAG: hypothetical protein Q8R39_03770 [bacterium]|nr:hypothetical protein [bacterium]MDZ4284372.1 hypothetical protein [Patescibacteria group bacterium]